MARQKKNGNKDKTLQTLVFVTAVLNLIKAIVDLIGKMLE